MIIKLARIYQKRFQHLRLFKVVDCIVATFKCNLCHFQFTNLRCTWPQLPPKDNDFPARPNHTEVLLRINIMELPSFLYLRFFKFFFGKPLNFDSNTSEYSHCFAVLSFNLSKKILCYHSFDFADL